MSESRPKPMPGSAPIFGVFNDDRHACESRTVCSLSYAPQPPYVFPHRRCIRFNASGKTDGPYTLTVRSAPRSATATIPKGIPCDLDILLPKNWAPLLDEHEMEICLTVPLGALIVRTYQVVTLDAARIDKYNFVEEYSGSIIHGKVPSAATLVRLEVASDAAQTLTGDLGGKYIPGGSWVDCTRELQGKRQFVLTGGSARIHARAHLCYNPEQSLTQHAQCVPLFFADYADRDTTGHRKNAIGGLRLCLPGPMPGSRAPPSAQPGCSFQKGALGGRPSCPPRTACPQGAQASRGG